MSLFFNQDKAVAQVVAALKEAIPSTLGGNSIAEVIDKYGDTHQLRLRIGIADNNLDVKAWLEDKPA